MGGNLARFLDEGLRCRGIAAQPFQRGAGIDRESIGQIVAQRFAARLAQQDIAADRAEQFGSGFIMRGCCGCSASWPRPYSQRKGVRM